ncbi:MAG TPA: hypothetical protein H9909_00155 [Candidatus Mediterraneibacter norfolkensis]|nr:hypothetical protein [Candidatus Mediterraneibacter norfolkensis]
MKAVCFGAAGGGIRLYDEICRKYDVVAFADNDKKSGGVLLWRQYIFSRILPEIFGI